MRKCKRGELGPRVFILFTLGPALFVLALITIFPFVINIINSLRRYYLIDPRGPTYIGIENFWRIFFTDSEFWHSLFITLCYTGGAVTFEFWLGLGIALLLNSDSKFRKRMRTVLLLPMAATPVAVAFIWRIMYSPSLGIINFFLRTLNLPESTWIGDPNTALLSLVIVDVWQWTPFMMLIFLAGLAALPPEPFEAARVDGAGDWQIFAHVTLPLLKPIAFIALLFRSIDAFKTFDIIFVLTRGGPGNSTQTLNLYTYLKGFSYLRMGYASALAIIMLIIVIIMSQLIVKYSGLQIK